MSPLDMKRRAARLEKARSLVAASLYGAQWPDLRWRDAGETTFLEGEIAIDEGFGCIETIEIVIEFGPNFPRREPEVRETGGRFPHIADRHFYPDGRCCLWHWLQSPWDENDEEALLKLLDEVALFFRRQLICDTCGNFPGPQLPHGDAGTRQAITELLGGAGLVETFAAPLLGRRDFAVNAPCPCGQTTKYKKCHQATVARIRQRVKRSELERIFGVKPRNSKSQK